MVDWTKEQEEAITSSGQDILVAAAAGSGKTAVLVERIIRKIISEEDQVDIDSLLVVTFTNAAAQEMRERIGKSLEEALKKHPESNHLKKQLSLLQRAPISTLHSFCMDLVRRYAYLLDIDPSFRIGNPLEIDLMKQDVLDELLEEWYGADAEKADAFFQVVDRFTNDRSDASIEKLILDLYTFSQENPYPSRWLGQLTMHYDLPEDWTEEDLPWLSVLKQFTFYRLTGLIEEAKRAKVISQKKGGPIHYVKTIEEDIEMFEEALEKTQNWDDLQAYFASSSFQGLSGKSVEDKALREQAKKIRDRYKEEWEKMRERYFTRNLAGHLADMQELYPIVKQLTLLVKDFSQRFTKHKRAAGILDFSDLEHYSLHLLIDENSKVGEPKPSELALQFKHQFTEVLVDEYQDINLVQETILAMLSEEAAKGNRFMVGDVKQSIYGFRHAEPGLFIEKYNRFVQEESFGKRIDLAKNFRSREPILTGANYIFRQIFDENLGDIHYDEAAELIYANKMYDSHPLDRDALELILIDREDMEEEESSKTGEEDFLHLEKAEIEARLYAKKIKEWVEGGSNPLLIYDRKLNEQRPMQYRDVAILLRSMTNAPVIVEELKRQGIPVYAELATGYFEAIEIKVMLNLLKIIDNPRQDIPLASVLKSPIVGLNEEELAHIRLADRNGVYFDALENYIEQEENEETETVQKVKQFLAELKSFQFLAGQGALSELIWEIYRRTGYYDFVGGIPGGRQRQANLRALYDRARSYETTSFRGLFRFLRFIERMEQRGEDLGAARALSEMENVVRITTIHKSKGLQYPVVIVGNIAHGFNLQDLNKRYLLHKDFGLASKYINPSKRIMYPTLFFHSLHSKILQEQLSEEMRVLYVALTRAQEKLLMVGQVNSFEETVENWRANLDHKDLVLPIHIRLKAKSYLDWIGPALIRHEDNQILRGEEETASSFAVDPSSWDISLIHASELMEEVEEVEEEVKTIKEHIFQWTPLPLDEDVMKEVAKRMEYSYPHKAAVKTRAKQSVTEIKRMHDELDDYSSRDIIRHSSVPITKRPLFMQKERKLTGAEVGTAMHTLMQHLPFHKALSKAEIEEQVNRLVIQEILTQEEAEVIQLDVIEKFFETEIAKLMIDNQDFEREVPFTITLPAKEVYPNWEDKEKERVLIQGVIDCLIPTEDGWILLDYKTDRILEEVTEEVYEELKNRYKIQMNLYRQAIEEILGERVSAAYVYYFSKQLLIKM